MVIHAMQRRLLVVALAFLAVSGLSCNKPALQPSTKVKVTLSGAVDNVKTWRVQATLDDKPSQAMIMDIAGSSRVFSLEVSPAGVAGTLRVSVQGEAESFPFLISKGSESVGIPGASEVVELSVPLSRTEVCTTDRWCWERPYPTGRAIHSVAAVGSTEAWAVGTAGLILHYDGRAWDLVESKTDQDLFSVFALSASEVYFGGGGDTARLLQWNGTRIQEFSRPLPVSATGQAIVAMWASGPQDIWCSVQKRSGADFQTPAQVFRWNGSAWSLPPQPPWGTGTKLRIGAMGGQVAGHPWIFGVKYGGAMPAPTLMKKEDAAWTDYSSDLGLAASTAQFASMVVKSDSEVWLAYDKRVLRFDGNTRQVTDLMAHGIATPQVWTTLTVSDSGDVWVSPQPTNPIPKSAPPWRYSQGVWSPMDDVPLPPGINITALAAQGADVWGAGTMGLVRKYSGNQKIWQPHLPEHEEEGASTMGLHAIVGTGRTNMWAVRNGKRLFPLRNDARGWTEDSSTPQNTDFLTGAWAAPPTDIWMGTGTNTLLRKARDSPWSSHNTQAILNSGWGANSNDVWAAGSRLEIEHWDGSSWSASMTPTQFITPAMTTNIDRYFIQSVWGVEGQAVWFLGGRDDGINSDTILWQYNATNGTWTDLSAQLISGAGRMPTGRPPSLIWASGKDDLWVSDVGANWIPYVSYNGSGWSKLASWCPVDNQSGALIWGSAKDNIWCFDRGGKGARQLAGVPKSVVMGGAESHIDTVAALTFYYQYRAAWAIGPDELWVTGDRGVILHRKPN